MEHHKLFELLNDSTESKFVTRKWIEVNDLSNDRYSAGKNGSNLGDFSDAYIVVKGRITVKGTNNVNRRIKSYPVKIILCLDQVYQKLITRLYTRLKILILLCRCII